MLYYYLTIFLQVFCLYHIYKNKNNYYWYFIVFFIPVLGCIIYILTQIINKRDVNIITEEITTIINPTKKVRDLEKKLEFSNTFQNRINLADAYAEINDYKNAILQYEEALKSNFKDEIYTLNKLIKCYFKDENYPKVISYSNKINLDKDFKDSIFFYGLALEKESEYEKAETELRKVDKRFSNYNERLELSKFFIRRSKKEEAKEVLNEIISEVNSMTKANARKYKEIVLEAEKLSNDM